MGSALRAIHRWRWADPLWRRIYTAIPRLRILSITGHSMYPGLAHGDCAIVFCRPRGSRALPAVGTIAVFRHRPTGREFVKRVVAVSGALAPGTSELVPPNCIWVAGDNPRWSVDSRHIGPIPVDQVTGTVALRIPIGVRPPPDTDALSDLPWVV